MEKDISSTYTWNNLIAAAKIISNNSDIITNDTEGVTVKANGKSISIGVGDTLKLDEKTVRVLGFIHDELVDTAIYKNGDGKTDKYAGISFEFLDATGAEQMNNSNSNANGWKACTLRTTLNNTMINNISIKNDIKEVKKKYMKLWGSEDNLAESLDKLWLLSIAEIFARKENNQLNTMNGYDVVKDGRQYKYYKNIIGNSGVRDNPKGKFRGVDSWLRTIISNGYCYMDASSFFTASHYANQRMAIFPGFCL